MDTMVEVGVRLPPVIPNLKQEAALAGSPVRWRRGAAAPIFCHAMMGANALPFNPARGGGENRLRRPRGFSGPRPAEAAKTKPKRRPARAEAPAMAVEKQPGKWKGLTRAPGAPPGSPGKGAGAPGGARAPGGSNPPADALSLGGRALEGPGPRGMAGRLSLQRGPPKEKGEGQPFNRPSKAGGKRPGVPTSSRGEKSGLWGAGGASWRGTPRLRLPNPGLATRGLGSLHPRGPRPSRPGEMGPISLGLGLPLDRQVAGLREKGPGGRALARKGPRSPFSRMGGSRRLGGRRPRWLHAVDRSSLVRLLNPPLGAGRGEPPVVMRCARKGKKLSEHVRSADRLVGKALVIS